MLATEKGLKYEIKRVNAKSNDIYVSNLKIEDVSDGSENIKVLLKRAQKNRAVAATNCNERSSRSHSVFVLKITGKNSITSESCTGTLNLVDLAGSERLKDSGSTGQRLEETKSINSSLSNLSKVIMALANNKVCNLLFFLDININLFDEYHFRGGRIPIFFQIIQLKCLVSFFGRLSFTFSKILGEGDLGQVLPQKISKFPLKVVAFNKKYTYFCKT